MVLVRILLIILGYSATEQCKTIAIATDLFNGIESIKEHVESFIHVDPILGQQQWEVQRFGWQIKEMFKNYFLKVLHLQAILLGLKYIWAFFPPSP